MWYSIWKLPGISRTFDEVVEISAVKVRSGQVVDEFSTLVNPGRHIPAGASQVNGITDQMVADCPLFSQVLQEFLNFTEGLTLVGHNIASFDMKFIWRDAEKYYGELVPNDYVDTLKVARTASVRTSQTSAGGSGRVLWHIAGGSTSGTQ